MRAVLGVEHLLRIGSTRIQFPLLVNRITTVKIAFQSIAYLKIRHMIFMAPKLVVYFGGNSNEENNFC
jgi:hypothetical protein